MYNKEDDIKKAEMPKPIKQKFNIHKFFQEYENDIRTELRRLYATAPLPPAGEKPTNRDWINTMSNLDFAKFVTVGLPVRDCKNDIEVVIRLEDILCRYDSFFGFAKWLHEPQEFYYE